MSNPQPISVCGIASTNDVLAGYSNADWTGNANDRKSISRGYFYVGNNLVSYMSKK